MRDFVFPQRVRAERIRLGLTQAEAARRLGMVPQSYRQLETQTLDPRVSTVTRLVRTLGMDPTVLLPGLFGR